MSTRLPGAAPSRTSVMLKRTTPELVETTTVPTNRRATGSGAVQPCGMVVGATVVAPAAGVVGPGLWALTGDAAAPAGDATASVTATPTASAVDAVRAVSPSTRRMGTAPAALEVGGPLLEERPHGFGRVGGGAVHGLGLGLVLERLGERDVERVVQQVLGLGQGDGRAGGQPGGPVIDEGVELAGGHDPVHEAERLGLLGRDDVGEE